MAAARTSRLPFATRPRAAPPAVNLRAFPAPQVYAAETIVSPEYDRKLTAAVNGSGPSGRPGFPKSQAER